MKKALSNANKYATLLNDAPTTGKIARKCVSHAIILRRFASTSLTSPVNDVLIITLDRSNKTLGDIA